MSFRRRRRLNGQFDLLEAGTAAAEARRTWASTLAIIFIVHWALGLVALVGMLILVALTVLDDRRTRGPPQGALAVERVVFGATTGQPPILKSVSFTLAAGACLAVIGPSAAGKSTLGYLPQDIELLSGKVAENIALSGDVADSSEGIVDAARMAGAHEMILRLPKGYETEVGEGGHALSGGQRQRIGLARALFGQPCLVVLDEPDATSTPKVNWRWWSTCGCTPWAAWWLRATC